MGLLWSVFHVSLSSDSHVPYCRLTPIPEICYTFSYIALHRKPDKEGWKRWSIRSTALVHQHHGEHHASTWILAKASERIQARLKDVINHQGQENNPLNPHLVMVSSGVENWRAYYNDLEENFIDEVDIPGS